MLRQLVKVTDAYPLTEADIALITTASSLHDIGKVGIPEEILNKPGRLTDEEFKIMKPHSEIGATLLRDMRFPLCVKNSAFSEEMQIFCLSIRPR